MPKGYHHVTREQRSQIFALKAIATPLNKIAKIIGLSPSDIGADFWTKKKSI